jgi:uncharacterized protein YbjT (DUF2867 family)
VALVDAHIQLGEGKTSPDAVEDVARVVAALVANPQPHIGKTYHLRKPRRPLPRPLSMSVITDSGRYCVRLRELPV